MSSSEGVPPVVPLLSASLSPPTRSTCPSGSSAATWKRRWLVIAPVGLNVPVAGSYSSAEAADADGGGDAPGLLAVTLKFSRPPATSTRPSLSSVAVWPNRATPRSPVAENAPEAGSVQL